MLTDVERRVIKGWQEFFPHVRKPTIFSFFFLFFYRFRFVFLNTHRYTHKRGIVFFSPFFVRYYSKMQPSSSLSSSSVFVEGLVYSQQGSGERRVFGSLARLSQELGAELCGRLSEVVLQQFPLSPPAAAPDPFSAVGGAGTRASGSFMGEVRRDLSAHYGSHALRRGLAKPFGPCVHPVLRKGKLSITRAGVHGPRYMRLWKLRRAHRCWCARCGVWLTRGAAASSQQSEDVLSTVLECRVRQRGGRRARHCSSRSSNKVTCKKFSVCCARCFHQAHKAAALAAGKQRSTAEVQVGSAQPPLKVRDEKTHRKTDTAATTPARRECMRNVEKAVAAVVAVARVPKRNRRCHRHSARHPRNEALKASAGKVKTTSSSSFSSGVAASTTAQVRQALTVSLRTAKNSKTTYSAAAAAAKAPTTASPPLACAAQKCLQKLVPSGPLKKTKKTPRPVAVQRTEPPQDDTGVARTVPAVHVVPTPPLRSEDEVRYSPSVKESRGGLEGEAASRAPETVFDKVMMESRSNLMKVGKTQSAAATAASKGRLGAEVSKEAPKTPAVASSLSVPKGPPVKALPKKPVKAPAKPQTKTSGKSKLMDAMNQLGF